MISINWATKVISVPLSYLTNVGGSFYEMDINMFRLDLKALEESEAGMLFPKTHNHNTEVTVGGIVLARVIEMINGYTITFESGTYAVTMVGANSNLGDVVNLNSVSVRSANSAGMIVSGSGVLPQDVIDIAVAVWDKQTSTLTTGGSVGKKLADSLPTGIQKNVAINNFQFFMTDETDHVSGKTGLSSFSSEVSIDGTAFTGLTNSVSEVGSGVYKINLTAGELNGNIITLKFSSVGADDRVLTIITEG